jgi:hypothetical protein
MTNKRFWDPRAYIYNGLTAVSYRYEAFGRILFPAAVWPRRTFTGSAPRKCNPPRGIITTASAFTIRWRNGGSIRIRLGNWADLNLERDRP